jgi:hypothetical protein
MKSAIRQW